MLAIARYDLFSPDLQRALDEISTATASHLGGMICSTTIVLDTALYFAGSSLYGQGAPGRLAEAEGVPAWSLFARVVLTAEPCVLPETNVDPIRSHHPWAGDAGTRTYAGFPLISKDGHVLGVHCTLGRAPRRYTSAELALLHRGARRSVELLEANRADQVPLTPNLRAAVPA
jgi:GAF domain-containing protein